MTLARQWCPLDVSTACFFPSAVYCCGGFVPVAYLVPLCRERDSIGAVDVFGVANVSRLTGEKRTETSEIFIVVTQYSTPIA